MSRILTFEPGMPSLGRAVVAIGVFDGVHLGHQALVRSAMTQAAALDAAAVVLTFDRDPDRVVMPAKAAPQLLELDDKVRLLSAIGPDAILVVPFDTALASLTPNAFIDQVILAATRPVAVVVGKDFRFGNAASGDVGAMAAAGALHGFEVIGQELLRHDGAPVTSTRVRGLLADGDVVAAARLLGRPHFVVGRVTHGRGEGRALGVPTANIATHSWTALPQDGVYAGRIVHEGVTYPCGVSVGVPPSFPQSIDRLEAHLLDYSGPDLYGVALNVEFIARIRGQRRFDGQAELARAIAEDLTRVRELVGE